MSRKDVMSEAEMKTEFRKCWDYCLSMAHNCRIPIAPAENINTTIVFNDRAVSRIGQCVPSRTIANGFDIEVSMFLFATNISQQLRCEAIMHLLLHTCPGTGTTKHGAIYRRKVEALESAGGMKVRVKIDNLMQNILRTNRDFAPYEIICKGCHTAQGLEDLEKVNEARRCDCPYCHRAMADCEIIHFVKGVRSPM